MAIPQRTAQTGTFFVTTICHNRRRLFQCSDRYRLIQTCAAKDRDLAAELARCGMSIDDLGYEIEAPLSRGDYAALDRFTSAPNGIPFVSLFAGCGGMDLGLKQRAFVIKWLWRSTRSSPTP